MTTAGRPGLGRPTNGRTNELRKNWKGISTNPRTLVENERGYTRSEYMAIEMTIKISLAFKGSK